MGIGPLLVPALKKHPHKLECSGLSFHQMEKFPEGILLCKFKISRFIGRL